MAVRDDRGDVKQTTTGFRDPRHHICQKQIPIPTRGQFFCGATALPAMTKALPRSAKHSQDAADDGIGLFRWFDGFCILHSARSQRAD